MMSYSDFKLILLRNGDEKLLRELNKLHKKNFINIGYFIERKYHHKGVKIFYKGYEVWCMKQTKIGRAMYEL